MRIPVRHPAFQRTPLVLEAGGLLPSPRLLLGGVSVAGWKGNFLLRGDDGGKVSVGMKKKWLDPVPTLELNRTSVELVSPLKWHEYLWICVPLGLVAAGGLLGALAGIAGACASARVFRSELPTPLKYASSALISSLAVLCYLGLAMVFAVVVQGCSAA